MPALDDNGDEVDPWVRCGDRLVRLANVAAIECTFTPRADYELVLVLTTGQRLLLDSYARRPDAMLAAEELVRDHLGGAVWTL